MSFQPEEIRRGRKRRSKPSLFNHFYIGLQIDDKPGKILFLQYECVNLFLPFKKKVGSTASRRLDISYPTTEFTKLVRMWEKFDEATMGIAVRHIKRLDIL